MILVKAEERGEPRWRMLGNQACGVLFGPAQLPEPFGRVFVEAALAGLPSVASRAGGIPEAVGEGGILLEPSAPPAAWAAAIQSALVPERRAALVAKA